MMNLSVVAPDCTVVNEDVKSVIAPGTEGYLGVLPGHVPVIVALQNGVLEYRNTQDQREYVAVSGGFMEISGNKIIVLADDAQHAREIDISQAEHDLEEARKALRGETSGMDRETAVLELGRAMNRIKAARRK